jgi:NADPH-dependent glutamate synthase beta subunit-like oxidoreductase
VTVFEARPLAGGLLRYGIPEYRLPRQVLDHEIAYIEQLGVEIRTGTPIDDVKELFERGYAAVFLGIGASQSVRLNVPGEEAPGVVSGLEFLDRVNSGATVDAGKTVIVVGGGSAAVDCARTALRLGAAQVHLVCLERRAPNEKDSMLAQEEEVRAAEEEGVVVHPGLGINRILVTDGRVTGIQCINCLSVRAADGTFAPQFDHGCTPTFLDADTVITAIGQKVDPGVLPRGAKLKVDSLTLQTGDPRVFAGGDAVSGPRDVISAVASGKAAALSIMRFLGREDLRAGRQPCDVVQGHGYKSLPAATLDLEHRKGFGEVELAFDGQTAKEQSERCLKCGTLVPSLVVRRAMPKKTIVPWSAQEALALWRQRNSEDGSELPPVYGDVDDVVRPPEPGTMGRDRRAQTAKRCGSAALHHR